MARNVIALSVGAAVYAAGGAAHAAVQFTQDHQGVTTAIRGLHVDNTCGLRPMAGKVVKRTFNSDEIMPTGFVLEGSDGTRTFINIDIDGADDWDEATRRAVYPGLQRLTKPGRMVRGRMLACGAAGGVFSVETVR
jgi:hypothetical protein